MFKFFTGLFTKYISPYWLYVKIAAVVGVLAYMGFLYLEKEHYKAIADTYKIQVAACQSVNAVNLQTIKALELNADKSAVTCAKKMKELQKVIDEHKRIDALTEGRPTNEGDVIYSGNALLDALNSVSPAANYAGGICKGTGAACSAQGQGQPGDVLYYCFSARSDALNYLKNRAEHDGRENVMEIELDSHQTGIEGEK